MKLQERIKSESDVTEEDIEKIKPLVKGNTKLGRNLIWHFSMMAVATCPGRTQFCEGLCYAVSFLFKMQEAYFHIRSALRRTPQFVERVCRQIRANFTKVVRIHVSGDFDEKDYIQKWIEIIKRSPTTEFFAYTRSWRDRELIPHLYELAALPNMSLFFSCDRETGQPPHHDDVRHAYLMENDYDAPPYLVDLVFRDKPETKMVSVNGSFVCPEERSKHRRKDEFGIKCENCRLCWGSRVKHLDRFNARLREKNQLPVLEEVA